MKRSGLRFLKGLAGIGLAVAMMMSSPPAIAGTRHVPEDFFGATVHLIGPERAELMNDLGIRQLRMDLHYATVEREPGAYEFTDDNYFIKSLNWAVDYGFDPLVVFTSPPEWAMWKERSDITNEVGILFPREEQLDGFEETVFTIASKYKGQIRYWEASNEPDIRYWKDHYVKMLAAFNRGVKRADPANKVVIAGFQGDEAANLDLVYQYGAKDHFDVVNSHTYTRPRMPEDGFLKTIARMRDVMRKHGDDKPIWVTEFGWNSFEPSMLEYLRDNHAGHRTYSVSEEDQARWLVRNFLLGMTDPGIERLYFFNVFQDGALDEVSANTDRGFGIVGHWMGKRERPKDGYYAVKALVKTLGDSTFVRRLKTRDDLWALAFNKGDEAIVALWRLDDRATLKLSDPSIIRGITSMMGTPMLVKDSIDLTGRPIYLHLNPDGIESLERQLARIQARPK